MRVTIKGFKYHEPKADKLSQLEDLAEQIGCPLDFVATPYKLSGLKKIWYRNQWCEVVRIVVYEEATKPYMEVRCKDYKYLKMILLEDYGKTWALTKEELEKPRKLPDDYETFKHEVIEALSKNHMAKTIKFTEKELEILRTLDVHDVCRASCFDSKMENKPYIHCEKCWVKLTIDSILEKIGE